MKSVLLILSLVITLCAGAQNVSGTFEGNNFRWMENTNSNLFYNMNMLTPGIEVPIGSSNHIICTHLLWIGGLDTDDSLYLTANLFPGLSGNPYPDNDDAYSPGPIRLDGTTVTSGTNFDSFNRFWHITRDQIEENIAYFDCSNNPGCNTAETFPNGYDVPEVFLTWPAHGDTTDGFAKYLAPFFDRNGDGEYHPENGDHPVICGDFEVYSIANDAKDYSLLGSQPLKVEVHTIVYGYNSTTPVLFNTLFVKRKIINRSSINYHDVYIGLWTDFELGTPDDDYLGTDVKRNMFYVYNGDQYDESGMNGPGYGDNPPAAGVVLLSGPLLAPNGEDDNKLYPEYEIYANQSTGWEDGIVDNERIGLNNSMYYSNLLGVPNGMALLPKGYYDYLRGIWHDGSPMYYGVGYSANSDGLTPAHYYYPGASDPLMAGTDGVDPQYPFSDGWTEENQNNPPGDRRMVASAGPFSMDAGAVQTIDYAIIFAQESDNGVIDVLDTLRSYADAIQGQECGNTAQVITGTSEWSNDPNTVSIYPNPTKAILNIHFSDLQSNLTLKMFDITGRLVLEKKYNHVAQIQLDINRERGIYFLVIDSKENHFSRKVVLD